MAEKPPFDASKPFEKAKPEFNPDLPFAGQAEEPSELESGLRGAAQGATFGFADELAGGLGALGDKLTGDKRDLAELYKLERDDSRAKYKAAEEANPTAYGAGKLAGGLASQGALAAATGGGSLAAEAGLGALGGALQGVGESEASSLKDMAKEAAVGGALGGVAGGAGFGLGKLSGAAIRKASPYLAQKLDQLAVAQGRRALTGGAESLSGKAALSDSAVREALDSGAIKFGGTTKGAADRLAAVREGVGKQYGDIIQGLEDKGITGANQHELADTLTKEADTLEANTLNPSVPAKYRSVADQITSKPADEAGNIGLTRAEDLKRSLQEQARYGKFEDTPANEAAQDIASKLRQANEDAIAKQAGESSDQGVKDLAEQFKPVKERLGNLIEADNAAFKGAQQADRRNAFGLRSTILAGHGVGAALAGHPLGLAVPVLSHIAQNRGASTVSASANYLSKSLGKLGAIAAKDPARLGKFGGVLASALQRGPQAFAAAHYVLSQSNPEYQDMASQVSGEPEQEP